jgi:purine-binding chemotaxis protein CheW
VGETTQTMHKTATTFRNREGKSPISSLRRGEYGLRSFKIREIIGMMPVTGVPRSPSFLKGVINLHGKVIPVVDLRLKSEMEKVPHTGRTCIIVVEIPGPGGDVLMGFVVDSVSEVLKRLIIRR